MNKYHLQEPAEILGGLLESRADTAAFFEPADQSLDDVAAAIGGAIELDRSGIAILVFLRRNHRADSQVDQVIVDPIRAVAFVAGQRHRPGDRFVFAVGQHSVRPDQNGVQHRRFVGLSRGQMKVQRVSVTVAENVDFRRPLLRVTVHTPDLAQHASGQSIRSSSRTTALLVYAT